MLCSVMYVRSFVGVMLCVCVCVCPLIIKQVKLVNCVEGEKCQC